MLQRPSQSLTSHLLSNTCSSAHHIFCQESAPLRLLPQTTRRSHRQKHSHGILSQKSHQQSQWQGKAQIRHLGDSGMRRMAAWPCDTRREDSWQQQQKNSYSLGTPFSRLCGKRQALHTTSIKATWFPPHKTFTWWEKERKSNLS